MTDLAVADLSHIPVSQGLSVTLARASEGARISGASEVSLEHVLAALCDDADAADVLAACNIDAARLKGDVIAFLVQQQTGEAPHGANVMVSAGLMRILEAAAAAARGGRKKDINGAIVLAAIVGDGRSTAAQILQSYGLTFEGAIRALQSAMAQPRPIEMAPAEDVLARARERVQSRSAPSLREIMQDKPHGLPAPPSQYHDIVAPPAGWEPAFPATQQPHAEPAPAAAQEAAAPEPPAGVPPGEEPAPVPAVEVAPPDAYVTVSVPAPQTPAEPEVAVAAPPVAAPPVQQQAAASEIAAPPPAPPTPPPAAPAPAAPSPANAPPAAIPPPPPAAFSPGATQGGAQGNFAPDFQPPLPPLGGVPPPPITPPPASVAPSPAAFERPRMGPQPPPIPPPIPQPAAQPAPQAAPYGYGAPPLARAPQGSQRQGAPAPAPSRPATKRSPRSQPEMGQLSENIPRVMRTGVTDRVEIRIARAQVPNLTDGMDGSAQAWRHDVTVTNAMSVRIRAPEGGFFIETASPETQWIDNQLLGAGEDFASWRFQITPQRRGVAHLQIIVSARSVGADGLAAETAFPDQVVQVKVRTNYKRAVMKGVGWIAAAVAGGILAKFGEGAFDAGQGLLSRLLG